MKNKLKKGDLVEVKFAIHPQITAKLIGTISKVFKKNGINHYTIINHNRKDLGTFTENQVELR